MVSIDAYDKCRGSLLEPSYRPASALEDPLILETFGVSTIGVRMTFPLVIVKLPNFL